MGQYTKAEGGQGRKPKLREERRNERHKSSENAQEKWNYQCEKGADLNSRPFSKMVGRNVRTGQNSLKLVHFLLKKGHDREKDHKWNNAIYQDDFCVRNCELLSRRFLQKSQTYIHITHSSDISVISVTTTLGQCQSLLRRAWALFIWG